MISNLAFLAALIFTLLNYACAGYIAWKTKTRLSGAKQRFNMQEPKVTLVDFNQIFFLLCLVLGLGGLVSLMLKSEVYDFPQIVKLNFLLVAVVLKPLTVYWSRPKVRRLIIKDLKVAILCNSSYRPSRRTC